MTEERLRKESIKKIGLKACIYYCGVDENNNLFQEKEKHSIIVEWSEVMFNALIDEISISASDATTKSPWQRRKLNIVGIGKFTSSIKEKSYLNFIQGSEYFCLSIKGCNVFIQVSNYLDGVYNHTGLGFMVMPEDDLKDWERIQAL